MSQYKLEVTNIEKSFPGVKALDNINFAVRPATVHVLCGENGAGKSTLMKIINGVYHQDAGEIKIDGKVVDIRNPIQAREHGVSMIFQELNFVPEMSVEESLILGKWPKNKINRIDWKAIRENAVSLLESEGLSYNPQQQVKELSVSDCQMLEILKAVSNNSSIIIMDEPTSAISNKEVESLFEKIAELKAKGVAIIYISHKMDEIFRIADDITILRDGTVVDTKPVEELTIEKVINLMVGREFDSSNYPKEEVEIKDDKLVVKNFSKAGVFSDINFHVKEGEIVGFAGLMGAGRTEVMRALFALDPYDEGQVYLSNKEIEIKDVGTSIKNKLVMLSEDRRRFGIIPVRDVKENTTLSSLKKIFYKGFLHSKEEVDSVNDICSKMNVKTPTISTAIEALSGGNQQKVVLAKWMLSDPEILILDEPTRGIDVGAKFEIYKLMTDLAKDGRAQIMVSSELPELIGMCDRIYVMAEGKIQGELERKDFSQENIMRYATGMK
ncbi:MAG: sugar ABC transporter ATP-binding protein [Pleomorphochaeta sp.]